MANNCYNFIYVSGDDLSGVEAFMKECMQVNDTGYGWLPEWMKEDYEKLSYVHYLFDMDDNGGGSYVCWTKWAPPVKELIIISRKLTGVTWEMEWEECGMGLYGRCVVRDGVMVSFVELTEEEVNQVKLDEEKDMYVWTKPDGTVETSESYSELYNEMLDQKTISLSVLGEPK